MIYVIVLVAFLAGMVFPFATVWLIGVLHDYVYMPLFWIPRHRRRCAEMEGRRTR